MAKDSNSNRYINYISKPNSRSKRMRLTVNCDMSVVVSHPYGASISRVDSFILSKIDWILEKLAFFKQHPVSILRVKSKKDYAKYKSPALHRAMERISYWNNFYRFKIAKVSIRNQSTRWGSCGKKANLNFNYKIIFLPEALLDYLIVHEICHLKEFNHSQKFWNLVSKTIADYRIKKKMLQKWSKQGESV